MRTDTPVKKPKSPRSKAAKPRKKNPLRGIARDALDREAWLSFLASHMEIEETSKTRRINGHKLSASMSRSYHRWSEENAHPSFFAADSFLVRCSLHIDDFLAFCALEGICPWARGEAPKWEDSGW